MPFNRALSVVFAFSTGLYFPLLLTWKCSRNSKIAWSKSHVNSALGVNKKLNLEDWFSLTELAGKFSNGFSLKNWVPWSVGFRLAFEQKKGEQDHQTVFQTLDSKPNYLPYVQSLIILQNLSNWWCLPPTNILFYKTYFYFRRTPAVRKRIIIRG